MEEIWKPIGYGYEVSNLGRIKSRKWGKENIINLGKDGWGYMKFSMSQDGVKKTKKVHRIVAENFLERIPGKQVVNHKNGDKSNNSVSNLEWCTQSENVMHAFRELGRTPTKPWSGIFGKGHPQCKRIDQIDIAGNVVMTWECAADIRRELGIQQSSLSTCCSGKRKTPLSGFFWRFHV